MSEYECYAPSNKSGSMYFDKQAINEKAVAFMYIVCLLKNIATAADNNSMMRLACQWSISEV